jgi:antirestriction protein
METNTTMADTMRVWIGCLACYNGGDLVGQWIPAVRATDFIPCNLGGHEEFWVMDHEGLGIDGECSPMEAQTIAENIADIENEFDAEIVQAYAKLTGLEIAEFRNEWQGQFEDSFHGVWTDFETFAQDYLDSTGELTSGGTLARYFDLAAFARDMAYDYSTVETSKGLAVFRDI